MNSKFPGIATRLKALLSSAHPKEHGARSWLARRLDISTATASNYLNGKERPGVDTLAKMAVLFGVTSDFILSGRHTADTHSSLSSNLRALPVLSFTEALNFDQSIGASPDMPQGWDHVSAQEASALSALAFAVRIADASMAPEFVVGDTILIEPERQPGPGDCVLAQVAGEPAAVFREWRDREGGAELAAQNGAFRSYRVGGEFGGRVLGTMVQHKRRSLI